MILGNLSSVLEDESTIDINNYVNKFTVRMQTPVTQEELDRRTNTDNRINYGPVLENIVYIYSRAKGYSVSVGRIGKLECDFILRNNRQQYFYV